MRSALAAVVLTVSVTLSLSKGADAQSATPAPALSPSPAPSAAPNPIGPAFGANDPCTSLAAIVGRPSVTNSVCTVRPNHVEIETGYLNTSANGGGNTVAYPQTLIRIGTAIPALELQVAPPGLNRTNAGGVMTGTTDAGAGLKYVFGYTPKFNYGGQVFFTAPTGTNGFSANGTNSTYALNAGYTLSPVFSVATTLATSSLTNGPQRWSSFVPSLVLGVSLPNATGLNAEIAQFSQANGPGTATRTQYLFAVYRDLGARVQLDASFATSPTAATGKYNAVGFGASFYF
ncbi:MAG: hypothetical protein M3169_17755 [Candidatus Eremiobacteraeota bacterium]|nr:hypothetical protein [Candidatus Eremiobacteraeota bacterium]